MFKYLFPALALFSLLSVVPIPGFAGKGKIPHGEPRSHSRSVTLKYAGADPVILADKMAQHGQALETARESRTPKRSRRRRIDYHSRMVRYYADKLRSYPFGKTESLPDELWVELVGHLPKSHRPNLSLVSRRMRRIAHELDSKEFVPGLVARYPISQEQAIAIAFNRRLLLPLSASSTRKNGIVRKLVTLSPMETEVLASTGIIPKLEELNSNYEASDLKLLAGLGEDRVRAAATHLPICFKKGLDRFSVHILLQRLQKASPEAIDRMAQNLRGYLQFVFGTENVQDWVYTSSVSSLLRWEPAVLDAFMVNWALHREAFVPMEMMPSQISTIVTAFADLRLEQIEAFGSSGIISELTDYDFSFELAELLGVTKEIQSEKLPLSLSFTMDVMRYSGGSASPASFLKSVEDMPVGFLQTGFQGVRVLFDQRTTRLGPSDLTTILGPLYGCSEGVLNALLRIAPRLFTQDMPAPFRALSLEALAGMTVEQVEATERNLHICFREGVSEDYRRFILQAFQGASPDAINCMAQNLPAYLLLVLGTTDVVNEAYLASIESLLKSKSRAVEAFMMNWPLYKGSFVHEHMDPETVCAIAAALTPLGSTDLEALSNEWPGYRALFIDHWATEHQLTRALCILAPCSSAQRAAVVSLWGWFSTFMESEEEERELPESRVEAGDKSSASKEVEILGQLWVLWNIEQIVSAIAEGIVDTIFPSVTSEVGVKS